MSSIFFSSHFFTWESLILFSNSQHLPKPILNAKNRELQTQCNSIAPRSTIMIGCICRIHLVLQRPRIRCSRSYAQHQLVRIQGLCPTLPIIFSCASELPTQNKGLHNSCVPNILAQHNKTLMCSRSSCSTQLKHSCAPKLLAQHKHSNTHVLQNSSLNKKHIINHVLQGPCPTHKIIHKTYVTSLRLIYQTNHHVHMQWGTRPNISKLNIKVTS